MIEVVSWRKTDYVMVVMQKSTAQSFTNRRTCKVCQGNYTTRWDGYDTKNKKSSNEAKVDDKNETAMKSYCTDIGNAVTNLKEFISICCVSVINTLKLGQRSVNICVVRHM